MVNKNFWLGIFAMVLVFGMTVVKVEAQSNNGGEFILTDIPAKYNGKYAVLMGGSDGSIELYGCDKMDIEKPSASCINDGKVILPLWRKIYGKFERYFGNHSVDVCILIYEKDDVVNDSGLLERVYFVSLGKQRDRVIFSNGSAIRSYNNRSDY